MTIHDKILLRRYFRQINAWLPCHRQQKKQILSNVKTSVSAFLSDNPGASLSQVEQHFGSPREIAAACAEEMDMPALLNAVRSRKQIRAAVAAGIAAALVLWAGGVRIAVEQQAAFAPTDIDFPEESASLSAYHISLLPTRIGSIPVYSKELDAFIKPSIGPRTVKTEADGTFTETITRTKSCYTADRVLLWEMTITVTNRYNWTGILDTQVSGTVTLGEDNDWYVISEKASVKGDSAEYAVSFGRKALGITTFTQTYRLTVPLENTATRS